MVSSNGSLESRGVLLNRRVGRVEPFSAHPLSSSTSLGWKGYLLERHVVERLGTRDVVVLNNLVIVQLDQPGVIEFKDHTRFVAKRVVPGNVSIRPCQSTVTVRSQDPLEFLSLSFEPGFLEMACGEFVDKSRVQLTVQNAVEDRLVESICLALQREVESGGQNGRLYSDSLASSLAVHLVARYGSAGKPENGHWPAGGPAMVRQAVQFMQNQLHKDLALRDIASAVGLSPFHFARRFKEAVGLSPYQFLLQERLSRARQMLVSGEQSIATIAVEVGFYDQSHFAQHFKRFHGMTPRQFAEQYRRRKPAG